MPHLIKLEGAIESEPNTFVPFSDWLALDNNSLADVSAVIVEENDSIIETDISVESLKVIAFNFAKFADGRAFSQARTLRETLNFKGDIRAMGDFIPDQVAFLTRCGFTSFECKNELELEIASRIKSLITTQYQSDVIEKQPLFRRR
ncbi:DUF934 domain-containing protein [Reinekea marina]|uniref:DUF934 domain-containing protein n=1 Tax=Reinekea marina TaxID=1310421 RepID=A0ABV7WUK8_9GAMM|nr:DUF934 domain-containing protein [Reinekea marina]MDN3649658.1 DUF934 domain-containing protein [Reinekea marina]